MTLMIVGSMRGVIVVLMVVGSKVRISQIKTEQKCITMTVFDPQCHRAKRSISLGFRSSVNIYPNGHLSR